MQCVLSLSLSVRLHTVVTFNQTKRLQFIFTEQVACLVRPDDILGPAVASVPRSDNVIPRLLYWEATRLKSGLKKKQKKKSRGMKGFQAAFTTKSVKAVESVTSKINIIH